MTLSPNPLVSIVTPSFNSAATIARNLASINAQSYASIEQIIVDNCSHDKTLEIVREQGLRLSEVLSEKDRGIADAFNKGISRAKGEIIAILNSDDEYFSPDVIEKVVRVFQETNADVVYGDMFFEDFQLGSNRRRPLLCSVEEAMPFNHPAFFVRKSIYDRFGLFDTSYRFTMDFEWVLRLYATTTELKVKAVYLNVGPLVKMRAGGATWAFEAMTNDEFRRALKQHGFWSQRAWRFWMKRKIKIQLKSMMKFLGLTFLVRWHRVKKWS